MRVLYITCIYVEFSSLIYPTKVERQGTLPATGMGRANATTYSCMDTIASSDKSSFMWGIFCSPSVINPNQTRLDSNRKHKSPPDKFKGIPPPYMYLVIQSQNKLKKKYPPRSLGKQTHIQRSREYIQCC